MLRMNGAVEFVEQCINYISYFLNLHTVEDELLSLFFEKSDPFGKIQLELEQRKDIFFHGGGGGGLRVGVARVCRQPL